MSNTKTFSLDLGKAAFEPDQSTGVYYRDSQIVHDAAGFLLDEALENQAALMTIVKNGSVVHVLLTTGKQGEIAFPADMEPCSSGCRCGDPAQSNAGTEIVTGGPAAQTWWANLEGGVSIENLAARAGETADAMDEVRSVMDVALDGETDATEAPKPAPLPSDASEPETAPVDAPAALDASPNPNVND